MPTAALTGYFSLHAQGERGRHTNKTLPVYLFSLTYRLMDDMIASSLQPCHVSGVRWGRSAAICCMRCLFRAYMFVLIFLISQSSGKLLVTGQFYGSITRGKIHYTCTMGKLKGEIEEPCA